MPSHATKFAELLAPPGDLLLNARLIEQVADLMHDTAFFIKDAAGRYVVVNQSIVERHGFTDKSQMLGRRPCEICPGDFGRIPTEQDAHVLRTGRPAAVFATEHWCDSVRDWVCYAAPVRDTSGAVVGVLDLSSHWRRANPRFQDGNLQANLALADGVAALARERGWTPAQLALAWLLDRGADIVPIPGTRRTERLDENVAAAHIQLSDAQRSQLAQMLADHPVAGTRYPAAAMAALNA